MSHSVEKNYFPMKINLIVIPFDYFWKSFDVNPSCRRRKILLLCLHGGRRHGNHCELNKHAHVLNRISSSFPFTENNSRGMKICVISPFE